MREIQVLDGCEEFEFPGGPAGALVLHGFTSSPQVVRPLGEGLAAAGIGALGPRLPGHGTTWQDSNRYSARDWVETVDDSVARLKERTDQVFVVGFSFGAALALDLAARRPDDVAGMVLVAPFLFTRDPRRFLAPAMAVATRSIPGVGNDIAHPTNREVAYERVPSRSAYSMIRFCARTKRLVPTITQPILILHSHNDHTAIPANAQYIHDNVGSDDKELVWYERSYHILPLDHDADDVIRRTTSFIQERSRSAV